MSDYKFNINNDKDEIIIREGKAQEIKDPKIIDLFGSIFAPADYLEKKKKEYKPESSYLAVDSNNRVLTLNLDAKNHFGTMIQGKLQKSQELEMFMINESKTWSNRELVKLFRMNKHLFVDHEEHRELISALEKFHASIEKKSVDFNDNKGNLEKSMKMALKDTSMTIESFKLRLPIFSGMGTEKSTIRVEFIIDISDASLMFYLISDELYQIIEEEKERIFSEQIERISTDFDLSVVRIS